MNEMNRQLQPLKVESKVTDTKYTVNEDGTVRVIETMRHDMTWAARDFLSFYREHQKQIDTIDLQLDKKHKDGLLNTKKEIEEKMKEIKPFIDDSEKKMIAHNQKLELENKTKALEDTLSKKPAERNQNMIQAIVQSLKEGDYEKIKKGLSKESYRAEFTRIMQDFRKQKARKK